MSTLAPKNVSPLIKTCRWGALLLGIAYGSYRYKSLAAKEVKIQEVEDKIRAERDARLVAERAERAKLEMDDLGKEAGVLPRK